LRWTPRSQAKLSKPRNSCQGDCQHNSVFGWPGESERQGPRHLQGNGHSSQFSPKWTCA
jgi:hypothetical protein